MALTFRCKKGFFTFFLRNVVELVAECTSATVTNDINMLPQKKT